MSSYKYLPISAAIEEYLSLTDDKGRIDRAYIKRLANSVVRKFTFEDQVQHKIALMDVVDNKVDLPKNLNKIVQVAYKGVSERKVRRTQVVEWMQRTTTDCNLVISLDCPKCSTSGNCSCDSEELIMDVDRDYLMSHPEHVYGNLKWYYRHGGLDSDNAPVSLYHPEFRVIKYARSTMFGADYHVKGCLNLESRLFVNDSVNYVNEEGSYLRLNVQEGQVLLSYLEYKTDSDGYRYIPDLEDLFEAIKWYIEEMTTYRLARKNVANRSLHQTYLNLSKTAKMEKLEAMGRSREKLRTMDFQNYWSFIENNWSKVYAYDDWQQNFNAPERDRYGEDMDRLTMHR
jgi:hypothetical protein